MFSSLSEGSWLADHAAPGPGYLGNVVVVKETRPLLEGEHLRAERKRGREREREIIIPRKNVLSVLHYYHGHHGCSGTHGQMDSQEVFLKTVLLMNLKKRSA